MFVVVPFKVLVSEKETMPFLSFLKHMNVIVSSLIKNTIYAA